MFSYSVQKISLMLSLLTTMTSAQFMPSRSTCFISPNIGQSLKKSSLKSYVESDQGSSPFVTEEEAERSLFCVDHFAECSVEEMEELRRSKSIHTIFIVCSINSINFIHFTLFVQYTNFHYWSILCFESNRAAHRTCD